LYLKSETAAFALDEARALAASATLRAATLCVGDADAVGALAPLARLGPGLGVTLTANHRVSDELIERLASEVPDIGRLDLDQGSRVGMAKRLTPSALESIARLSGLRWLSLRGCAWKRIEPAAVAPIGSLEKLEQLSLEGACLDWTSAATVALAQALLPALRMLDLGDVPLSPKATSASARCRSNAWCCATA
jgi:hypothetical protein